MHQSVALVIGTGSSSFSHAASMAAMHAALDVVDKNESMFRHEFRGWLETNWHVWERFDLEADKVYSRGRTHYSARTLIEFIRHETFIRESKMNFKVNNSFVPDIGRLYGLLHLDRQGFFECRDLGTVCVRTRIRSSISAADGQNTN